jgi:CO dehydrogenase/acetyl-CoA synthase epsilon subunit
MARGQKHSDETRAAVISALLQGQGVNEVATAYNLDKSIVSRIKKSVSEGELQQVATQKKESIADLVENHLRASLAACANIANITQDVEWVSKQTGDNLAVFYGVMSDKSLRLLEAAQNAARAREIEDES